MIIVQNETTTAWDLLLIDLPQLGPFIDSGYVLSCTFNDPGGKYYIQIDSNFVKRTENNVSILGINPNVWTFQTAMYRDIGAVHWTVEAYVDWGEYSQYSDWQSVIPIDLLSLGIVMAAVMIVDVGLDAEYHYKLTI
ncbi:6242_t:CDS:2 [Scutellospora calospora]|uniref:6242_t:CDS:1 n=1 Tax=Scutellospora calospora TaxID=85575 RepID=A0ACA9KT12_9GLOM|nr:6242_t:CDS:2 [Scutellospora calospora]